MFGKKKEKKNSVPTATEAAQEMLKNVLALMQQNNISLPQQIDQITTMTAVTAEGNAVRWHYVLSQLDPAKAPKSMFQNMLFSQIKQDERVKDSLKSGVGIEYDYTFAENKEIRYLISFSKEDFNL